MADASGERDDGMLVICAPKWGRTMGFVVWNPLDVHSSPP